MSATATPPRDLLAQSPAVRLQYFKDFAVAHTFLVEAKNRLMEAITDSAPNSLVMVLGPTGVGKTTLLTRVRQLLWQNALDNVREDPARLPVVTIEAVPPDSRIFSWRSHFKRLLLEMNDPMVDDKRQWKPASQTVPITPSIQACPNHRGVTADYDYAVEQALRYRRPRAILIDEAQHLFTPASGRRLEDQLNVLKSLANRSNTVHVLCGTYELLRIRNLSGQLSRRSIDIHFPRYDAAKAADRRTFIRTLQTFAEQMPVPEPPDLVQCWEYLYERSIGCIGVLKDWLVKGLTAAIRESALTLTLKHLEKHALSISQCERLTEEAVSGESRFHDDSDALQRLRLRLRLPTLGQSRETPKPALANHPRRPNPGQRNPKRDVIGPAQFYASCQTR